ncbi:MAG: DUF3781 domain-containing protein [Bacilli bacterium]|nr:DUF3781 domain-containing protein [Bacilli bacterium]
MKEELIKNIEKLHTTKLGEVRIQKNLNLSDTNVVNTIKNIILKRECKINQKGKNIYCETKDIILTINKNNFCIITAHKK